MEEKNTTTRILSCCFVHKYIYNVAGGGWGAQKVVWATGARDTRRPNAVKIAPKRTVSSRSDTTCRGTLTTTVWNVGE